MNTTTTVTTRRNPTECLSANRLDDSVDEQHEFASITRKNDRVVLQCDVTWPAVCAEAESEVSERFDVDDKQTCRMRPVRRKLALDVEPLLVADQRSEHSAEHIANL